MPLPPTWIACVFSDLSFSWISQCSAVLLPSLDPVGRSQVECSGSSSSSRIGSGDGSPRHMTPGRSACRRARLPYELDAVLLRSNWLLVAMRSWLCWGGCEEVSGRLGGGGLRVALTTAHRPKLAAFHQPPGRSACLIFCTLLTRCQPSCNLISYEVYYHPNIRLTAIFSFVVVNSRVCRTSKRCCSRALVAIFLGARAILHGPCLRRVCFL